MTNVKDLIQRAQTGDWPEPSSLSCTNGTFASQGQFWYAQYWKVMSEAQQELEEAESSDRGKTIPTFLTHTPGGDVIIATKSGEKSLHGHAVRLLEGADRSKTFFITSSEKVGEVTLFKAIDSSGDEASFLNAHGGKGNKVRILCYIHEIAARLHGIASLMFDKDSPGPTSMLADPTTSVSQVAFNYRGWCPGISPPDASQAQAIHNQTSCLDVIIGPPGTGKSATIVHSAFLHSDPSQVVAVIAPNSHALEALVEKFAVSGIPFIAIDNGLDLSICRSLACTRMLVSILIPILIPLAHSICRALACTRMQNTMILVL